MAIQLVPYNNAMRLGQGFNSYTQQICVDDAVVIDPYRAENVVTNDGVTMRIIAEKSAAPSAWSRQPEVVNDDRATKTLYNQQLKETVDELQATQEENVTEDSKNTLKDTTKDTRASAQDSPDTPSAIAAPDVPADSGTVDSAADEPPNTTEEISAEAETNKSDSLDIITEDDVKDKTSDSTSGDVIKAEAGDTPEVISAKPTEKQDTVSATTRSDAERGKRVAPEHETSTPQGAPEGIQKRTLAVLNSTKKPTSEGTGSTTASKATLQRAAAKLKAEAATKKEEERVQAEARQKEANDRKKREHKRLQDQIDYEEEVERDARKADRIRRDEERAEQVQIRKENRDFDKKRRDDARKAIEDAANLKATSLEDIKKIAAQNQFAERFAGMLDNKKEYTFNATGPRGPSQTVTYSSRFVDRLSDVTEDMCISGSLSVKAGKIGGSGKGSFVDSDKFKESDMNFYISVKVVNQTINFKDALVYNPVASVTKDNFTQVFGDSFISGFVEGGEFNALVSMKILNKAKKLDIQAEAKVALTAGSVNIEAEANVGIARNNLETNTETTIQVSWCGGGHIKPMEQQWDITSLMEAAARFPDLVADCPQRTYAIVTKYDTLRSFLNLKPIGCTPLQYENAQMYTNSLLDSFVTYKSLYKKLGEQIFGVQGKTLEIASWGDSGDSSDKKETPKGAKDKETGIYPYFEDMTRFEASIKGLSDARSAVRRQMARIVNEVDHVEKNPKLCMDEDHKEPFQAPVVFETRLPNVDVPGRFKRSIMPLTGMPIKAKALSETEQRAAMEEEAKLGEAPAISADASKLSKDETAALEKISSKRPGIGRDLRVTSAVGSDTAGEWFNNLDIIQPDWTVSSVTFQVYLGCLSYLAVTYGNGLIISKGAKHKDGKMSNFGPLSPGERVISASIETGRRSKDETAQNRILAVGLFTNRGRSFIATAPTRDNGGGKFDKDGVSYDSVQLTHFDGPVEKGTFKGFFGRSSESTDYDGGILRLGIIWGRSVDANVPETETKPLSLAPVQIEAESEVGCLEVSTAAHDSEMEAGYIRFRKAYSEPPVMISGIASLDAYSKPSATFDTGHFAVTNETAKTMWRKSSPSRTLKHPPLSWLSLPSTERHIETGTWDIVDFEESTLDKTDPKNYCVELKQNFSRPFKSRPSSVIAWYCGLTVRGTILRNMVWIPSGRTDANSFVMQVSQSRESGTSFAGQRIGWMAWDSVEVPTMQAGYISSSMSGNPKRHVGRRQFVKKFTKVPKVILLVSGVNSTSEKGATQLDGHVSGVTTEGFDYDLGTILEKDTMVLNTVNFYTWIAVE